MQKQHNRKATVKNVIIKQTFNPHEEKGQKDVDNSNELLENLKITYDLAKTNFEEEISRAERLDNKFNYWLVFVAGLIAGLNIVFPYSVDLSCCLITINNIVVSLFLACITTTIVLICIGMFPRAHKSIREDTFTSMEFHSKATDKVYGGYIKGLYDSIVSCYNTNEKKAKLLKATFVFSAISLLLFSILLIIKIL